MTEIEAADIWAVNVTTIRRDANAATEAVYETWLNTRMEIVERDARMSAVWARMNAAIDAEKRLYYANRALAAA